MKTDQEQIKSKLDELIRRLEYFNRDYQNVPLQLARDIQYLVIGEQSDRVDKREMIEISKQREDWIPIYGSRAYEILKVRVQLEDGEETDWWKIYDVQSGHPGGCGHRNFIAHAPSREAAYDQIERLKNGPHTHLGCVLAAGENQK